MSDIIRRKEDLTLELLKECVEYNPDTGDFKFLHRPSYHFKYDHIGKMVNTKYAGTIASGLNDQGYLIIRLFRYGYRAHQLAYLWMTGQWPPPGFVIDHIDRVRDNNKWSNLRLATLSDNARNASLSKSNTSGVTGVYWDKQTKKWRAMGGYRKNGKRHYFQLGRYEHKFDAICARKSWEVKVGGFTPHHGT
ncbi:HNH endonuclease signature motif containing protein [Marinobacter nauticus]|uniref:HNH endonuclease signature motif containing protein n=1 Tax=Marinobacter nauticus TaxID=2743 RepID=UPI001C99A6F2|nr:HNH endonuclease signature motif containing protein [Marinobacter nauticus]MBY5962122.1 HNH endonuclease [Marinobacter nauticus]